MRFYNNDMQSLSKTPISRQLAEQIVARTFGSRTSISSYRELKDGFFNSAYFLELNDGTQCVLKIAPHPSIRVLRYEKNIMQTEVEVIRLVNKRTDIPVPSILCYDPSRSLIESDYFVMDFIEGVPLNKIRKTLSPDECHAIDKRTGQFLNQMNAITGDQFGSFTQPELQTKNWLETFDRMLRNVLADGQDAGVILPADYGALYSQLAAHYQALDEVQIPRLVHWDLWDGNIFIHPETKQITGLIDFERALWADPLMEVNFGAFGTNPSFMEGYGKDMLATINQKRRHTLYDVYLFLIMIIECYFRKYENNQQENWSREKLKGELEILNTL
jgi:aminoglycoside phosphotransferase (APT) family kinase protein